MNSLAASIPVLPEDALGDPLYAVELPPPLSVNNLFHTRGKYPSTGKKIPPRGKTRSYQNWIATAGQMLVAQGPRPALGGRVAVIFTLADGKSGVDTDNVGKAYLDLLVKMGVLPDDGPHIVKHLSYTWTPGERFTVHIFRWRPQP